MGPTPPTTTTPELPRLELVRNELRIRNLEVRALSRPTPRLVRIALGGEELEGFSSAGPADHVKIFLPPPGGKDPILPQIGPEGVVATEGPRPVGRDYTPRHHRLHEGLLELDVVLHDGGAAATWAATAEVGDRLAVGGPRGSHVPAGVFGGLVLVGDETALPAIHNWLRWAPRGLPVVALIEVQDDDDVQPLTTDADLSVRWLPRHGQAPGTSDVLVEALSKLGPLPVETFVWVAAEAEVARRARLAAVEGLGVDPALVHSRGYWKRGTADHQEPHSD